MYGKGRFDLHDRDRKNPDELSHVEDHFAGSQAHTPL